MVAQGITSTGGADWIITKLLGTPKDTMLAQVRLAGGSQVVVHGPPPVLHTLRRPPAHAPAFPSSPCFFR